MLTHSEAEPGFVLSVAWATFNTKTWTTPRWASSTTPPLPAQVGDPSLSGTAGRRRRNGGEGRREEGEERRGDFGGGGAQSHNLDQIKESERLSIHACQNVHVENSTGTCTSTDSKFSNGEPLCALHVNLFEHLEEAKLFHDPKCFLHLSAVLHNKEEEENIELQLLKFVKEGEGTETDGEIKEQRC